MHTITARIDSTDVRLCQMSCKFFDGIEVIGKPESEDLGEGRISMRQVTKKVLSDEIMTQSAGLRSLVFRTMDEVGFKTSLGTLVSGDGMAELLERERVLKETAEHIKQQMVDHLTESGEKVELARCEIELTELCLTPGIEFENSVENLIQNAAGAYLENSVEAVSEACDKLIQKVETGYIHLAHQQIRKIHRIVARMRELGWADKELDPIIEDLKVIKDVLSEKDITVAEKVEKLKQIELMQGVKSVPDTEVAA